jgi:hypothetical protein
MLFTAAEIYGLLEVKLLECGIRRYPVVHPRLVICLILSIAIGFAAAGSAVAAGWSLIWALPIYSLAGSLALVASTLLAALAEDAVRRLPSRARPARVEPVHA